MKLSTVLLAAAGIASTASAQALSSAAGSSTAATVAPLTSSTASSSTAATTASSGTTTATVSGGDVFANLKTKTHPKDAYHMPAVRAVHARVQSDAPILVDGVFVSSFGAGELEAGYQSAMDTVNTASVEGALMYVQAEGININVRAEEERCERKSGMANIVFYEVIIVQTNESLAQFQDSWGKTPEYGPMLPMDSGRCTPLSGDDDFPAGCLQFNGDDDQPNVGPFIGGGIKDDDVRAPYPDNYWFSFPGTCPLQGWGDKTDECRESTRKGLCSYGQGPDGVDCTFAYNVLGWVTIDDIVGITAIDNPDTGSTFANFTEWCMADSNNTEFAANADSGEMETGLPFWEDPLNSTANAARAEAAVAKYEETLKSGSSQIEDTLIAAFRTLPTPEELAESNPPCYKTVEACGSGNGCKRVGYSQLCTECTADEGCPTGGSGFEYPKLEKAYTTLSENETTTNLDDSASGKSSTASGSAAGSNGESGAAPLTFTVASVAVGLVSAVLAL
ncbi:hypothetical protein GN244_ATG17504 [Phytophthora infestans]|uniref:Uncharacterized protein n=1 Tax=Phytophthora infestans TaxID=4787 RepID=A0A833WL38_PHYIN|nr:hypothetical protein GN244_ATG17504 [Phytophthora infestans]KAF4127868.1 hypothetical protein GN958_ATG22924 [Phytophthora infestans]KAI9998160.1 hypothetical protein PInf_002494 [Phytophthora infestans]